MAKKNAAIWTRADLLLTDAFFHLVKDIRQGRLNFDSVTLAKGFGVAGFRVNGGAGFCDADQ